MQVVDVSGPTVRVTFDTDVVELENMVAALRRARATQGSDDALLDEICDTFDSALARANSKAKTR